MSNNRLVSRGVLPKSKKLSGSCFRLGAAHGVSAIHGEFRVAGAASRRVRALIPLGLTARKCRCARQRVAARPAAVRASAVVREVCACVDALEVERHRCERLTAISDLSTPFVQRMSTSPPSQRVGMLPLAQRAGASRLAQRMGALEVERRPRALPFAQRARTSRSWAYGGDARFFGRSRAVWYTVRRAASDATACRVPDCRRVGQGN